MRTSTRISRCAALAPWRMLWTVLALVLGGGILVPSPAWAHRPPGASPTPMPVPEEIQPAVGLNKFDLFMQYLGRDMGGHSGPAFQRVSRAMARKAIADAAAMGVSYLRVSATGFTPTAYGEPGDLGLWLRDPEAHWALFDQMMADLQASGIRIVPVFVWQPLQFPALSGQETLTDLVTDPDSWSYRTLTRYMDEFIARYRAHPALYFYELTNELNDQADVDLTDVWCRDTASDCDPVGNFSTDEMLAFMARLARFVRERDGVHRISSGFNLPRPEAVHLRGQPGWSPGGGDWTADSRAEFRQHLAEIHQDMDIISVHFYNGLEDNGSRSNLRWGLTGRTNVAVLDEVKRVADAVGKLLFIGEFGDQDPTVLEDPEAAFSRQVLDKIVELQIPFSAPWVWQFYPTAPYLFTPHNIEPGYTDRLIAGIRDTNRRLGNDVPEPIPPDRTPPRVILVWPLQGAALRETSLVAAVASDDREVVRVVFWVDSQPYAVLGRPPFGYLLDPTALPAGIHRLRVVAWDAAGNSASDAVWVRVGRDGPDHRIYLPQLMRR